MRVAKLHGKLWTDATVAKVLHTTPRTLAGWRSQGLGPNYYKIGKRIRYSASDVTAYLERQRVVVDRLGRRLEEARL